MQRLLSLLGTSLIIIGVGILIFTYSPVVFQEAKYTLSKPSTTYQVAESSQEAASIQAEPTFEKTVIIPKSFDFSLVIPAIGVNSVVYPNIDSGNPDIYLPVLKKGVAHALNSSLPNQTGPVFIFAHSTDTFYNITQYNAVFFLLNKLTPASDVYLFYQNRRYHYQVSSKQVVAPEDIPGIVRATTGDTLILQTCYPPGTTIKRLLVFAKPL